MRIGDVIESSIWMTGEESEELKSHHKERVCAAIDEACEEAGLIHAPVVFSEKRPEEDRVPPVPDHISGPCVRLLVAETEIVGEVPKSSQGSFIANLERRDLVRLRHITRRAWATCTPHNMMTDAECDAVIEQMGPEAAVAALRQHVGRVVH